MIISRAEIRSAVAAYKAVKRKPPTVDTLAFDTSDSFIRSEAAISLADVAHTVVAEPLYRAGLVEDLNRRISEGRYFVPSEEIVDKLLGRLIVEAVA